MKSLMQINKFRKGSSEIFVMIIITALGVLAWAGWTKAGYLPNFLNIEFLCPGSSISEERTTGFFVPDNEKKPSPTRENIEDSQEAINNPSEEGWYAKPIIYLYPENQQEVSVKLDYNGKIIADYPEYNNAINGWKVMAYPDGHLINYADNQEYSYLFWEGEPYEQINWDMSKGFVVEGKYTREFLQETLFKLGLTPKEYNEFIVYWYPRMKNNKYNLITFAGKQYTDTAPLTINPKPDSMLRVFMVFKPLDEKIEVQPQALNFFNRQGFTVVEWGGTELE